MTETSRKNVYKSEQNNVIGLLGVNVSFYIYAHKNNFDLTN